MSEQAVSPTETGIAEADLTVSRDEFMRRFRAGVRRELATQLSAGHPVYYGGIGAEAGTLFVHGPDGRRFEYHVLEDGTHELIREILQWTGLPCGSSEADMVSLKAACGAAILEA